MLRVAVVVRLGLIGALLLMGGGSAWAESEPEPEAGAQGGDRPLRLDASLALWRFEQQVKSEIGGARGERLVEETYVALLASGSWRVWGPLEIGGFVQADLGSRKAGRFAGFDENDQTVVEGEVGGDYSELWAGPLIRARWRGLFAELGYGLVAVRSDDGRTDLPNDQGDTDGRLRLSRSVAWTLGAGGAVPITDQLSVLFRLQYRVRYYTGRDGRDFEGDLAHGTQNITPFVGLDWAL